MSSINTNASAMTALSTLRNINRDLEGAQDRISTGLKISSGKDNAAYFAISKTMSGDSSMYKAIDESLTLQQNSVSTARLGAETVADLADEFLERVAFAQGSAGDQSARTDIQTELNELAARIQTVIDQSTFNGESLVKGAVDSVTAVTVVTGITRSASGVSTTTITYDRQDLTAIQSTLANIDISSAASAASAATVLSQALTDAQGALDAAITSATALGVAEKSIETQKQFLGELTDRIDVGVGSMVDANMEEEAARLQALQVQQQLATQSLSIANQAPQNILSLFR
ncbi:flagellin [Roseivivax isoporae]|uniref:Flagellin n=1 Tax=Roseivivax isoporae LMG 25204 TaxID=1449351 RepID=X7F837_9RHOB|nr:flagellin [Roseivivax isoporae]ETX28898.1 flagellin family protein [Roseivivax isoporae LMG 25204]